ncbi:MAG: ABC transporter permease [Firmicutes bacterium]|nr:ABC transporter permease [Bacillota bacterium]
MSRRLFRERMNEAWLEIRENLGRASLQSLGIMLGVASVLGGFSITDSFKKRSEQLYVKMGGLDKLNVQTSPVATEGSPTAMRAANLGLRQQDREDSAELKPGEVQGVSMVRSVRARVRSAQADQERQVLGIGGDHLAMEGYSVAQGRSLSTQDVESAAPVALLGSSAATDFFPNGDALGSILRIGNTPVQIVGVLEERYFVFSKENPRNQFWRRNRIIAVPSSLVQRRLQGDVHSRLDRITYRIPRIDAMPDFISELKSILKPNHRMEEDFRLDDVQSRIRKRNNNGEAYNLIFVLSGVLALLGGGLVNVNIQLASLKERVKEIGVRMALGAPGNEIFKSFMTEALLLTSLGGLVGLGAGVIFSWAITTILGVPLAMAFSSFMWAYLLAVVFGFAFALYPAWRASKLSPMEALHYE